EGQRFAKLMWDGLSSLMHVRLYGVPPSEPRTPTIGFTVDGMTAEAVTRALVRDGLYTSHGDFYAATVIERLGVDALVRAGCACYTTEEEVTRLIEAIRACHPEPRRRRAIPRACATPNDTDYDSRRSRLSSPRTAASSSIFSYDLLHDREGSDALDRGDFASVIPSRVDGEGSPAHARRMIVLAMGIPRRLRGSE